MEFITLSQENIDSVENFIANNEPVRNIEIESGEDEIYEQMKGMPATAYVITEENALGMNVYGLYKSHNGHIYLINTYINEIKSYATISCK